MEEYHPPFIFSIALVVLLVSSLGIDGGFLLSIAQLFCLLLSLILFLRGFYLMIPIPYNQTERMEFMKDHPEVHKLKKAQRFEIYESWKDKRNDEKDLSERKPT
ncbi:hypothetical protein QEH56_24310 [Pelagicoccus enzymogenes]|uniref:hypothetical protein n=1 Tax=Pelagicoccus enzymogenes TaxID=2773457 RepID=UPI00280D081B|nr:hypothetical protein [Pelagicoccus enzymogenes]MDQ8201305.1 hypothetical protein [Pelagicoccus enzymogenes]